MAILPFVNRTHVGRSSAPHGSCRGDGADTTTRRDPWIPNLERRGVFVSIWH
jgi:hypothetical protein